MKTLRIIFSFLLISAPAFAQEATTESGFMRDPFADPLFPLYLVIGFVFVTAVLVVLVALYMLKVLNIFIRKAAEERAEKSGIVYTPEPGYFSKFWVWINGFRSKEEEKDIMMEHSYDGIRELDNHMPPWWKWLFYATIIWGVGYLVVYHVTSSMPLMEDEYLAEVEKAAEQKAKLLAANPPAVIDENALVYEHNEEILKKGRTIYVTNCASCHMADGQGSIGPNLTDDYWLHGGSIKDIYLIVKNGVVEKGMIPWAPVLSPEQMRDVSFYIKSLKGTNPPNPKAPQGELYVEEEAAPAADTVKIAGL
ncbi:MAG: c-type cytochrome [Cyclobacteriaceae bacterium]|nr:c-type cytochrome [Cyclobacteriaceae bacterium]